MLLEPFNVITREAGCSVQPSGKRRFGEHSHGLKLIDQAASDIRTEGERYGLGLLSCLRGQRRPDRSVQRVGAERLGEQRRVGRGSLDRFGFAVAGHE